MSTIFRRLNQRLRKLLSAVSARLPKLVSDGMFTIAAKGTSQVVQLAIFILAARVLTSAEFGFFAFISAFLVMLIVLAEGGWGEFLLKSHDTEAELDKIATTAIASGGIVSVATLAGAVVMTLWLADPVPGKVLGIFSVLIFLSALSTIYDAILVSRGRLRTQAIIRIAAELFGLVFVAFGLWAGWNIFALFAGRLAMQSMTLLGSAIAVGWVPRLRMTRPFLREILGFSRHILANRLIFFLRSYSATLAVGSFLGLSEAGYYRAAERIVSGISELVAEPARMLSWVVFRRARERTPREGGDDAAIIARAADTFLVRFIALAAPLYLCLALASGALVHFVLGETWMPAAVIVSILAVRQMLLIPSSIVEPLLSMVGELRRLPPIALANGSVAILFIVMFAPFGLIPLAVGQCLVGAFWLTTMIRLQQRYGGLDWIGITRRSGPTFVALAAMLAADTAIDFIALPDLMPNAFTSGFEIFAGALVYVAVLVLFHKVAVVSAAPAYRQNNS